MLLTNLMNPKIHKVCSPNILCRPDPRTHEVGLGEDDGTLGACGGGTMGEWGICIRCRLKWFHTAATWYSGLGGIVMSKISKQIIMSMSTYTNLGYACFNLQEPVWIPGVEKAAAAYWSIFEIWCPYIESASSAWFIILSSFECS